MTSKKYYLLSILLGIGLFLAAAVQIKAAAPRLSDTSVQKGKKITMKVYGLDEKLYPSSTWQWKSSSSKIATVSSKGTVTGKKPGKAKITLSVKNTKIRLTATVRVVSYFRTRSVTIKNKPEDMLTNEKLSLKAEVSPSRAKYKKIIWSSSQEKVATISSKGTIRTHKKGTTVITASVKGTTKQTSFKLRVKNRVKLKKITVSGSQDVFVGSHIQLSTALSPKNTTYDSITWKSSNKKVATVNQDGTVYGHKEGTVTITATEKDCKKKAKYKIRVHNVPVTALWFDSGQPKSMENGSKLTLKVHMNPGNATDKRIKWKSSNKTAATVDENGTVTALRPIESVDITATSLDNKNLSCTWNLKITITNGFVTKSTLDNLDLTVIDKVMITAHPDDETLWGGGHLLENEYLVVCMTHGWNERRRTAFEQTMRTTNDKYIILNYPDARKEFSNGSYETDLLSTSKAAMQKDIQQILSYKKWKQVVTHNPSGEYGKYHHKTISNLVTAVFNKYNKKSSELWYFGRYYNPGSIPGEQIAPNLLAVKKQMVNRYYPTAKGAILAFGHMIPYENWIPASDW